MGRPELVSSRCQVQNSSTGMSLNTELDEPLDEADLEVPLSSF